MIAARVRPQKTLKSEIQTTSESFRHATGHLIFLASSLSVVKPGILKKKNSDLFHNFKQI